MQLTAWSNNLRVTGDGSGVASHAGMVLLRLLVDRVGLTGALSTALARRRFFPVHDRGRVLTDVAMMIADGGEAIADIDVLRHQDAVLGPVAAPATVWRTLDALDELALRKISRARAGARAHVWSQLPALPASRAGGGDPAPGVAGHVRIKGLGGVRQDPRVRRHLRVLVRVSIRRLPGGPAPSRGGVVPRRAPAACVIAALTTRAPRRPARPADRATVRGSWPASRTPGRIPR